MKQEIVERNASALFNRGIRFISGKWFNISKNMEINNIDHFLFAATGTTERNALDRIKDSIMIRQESTGGFWPDIVWPETVGELPFPLDDKQMVILNRLLYHKMDSDRSIFITCGIGGSGKSTFLNIVRQLHNCDCANSNLSDLSNEFLFAEAVSHRLICSDELASGELDLPKLKILASHEKATVNPKCRIPYETQTQSNLFWCCNSVPKLDITDSGMLRRIVFYERNTKIENPNTSLSHKVYSRDELAIIATKAKEYEDDKWFENNFEKETYKYLMKSNSVYLCWADDYQVYRVNCNIKGYRPFAEEKWKEIHDLFEGWKAEL